MTRIFYTEAKDYECNTVTGALLFKDVFLITIDVRDKANEGSQSTRTREVGNKLEPTQRSMHLMTSWLNYICGLLSVSRKYP